MTPDAKPTLFSRPLPILIFVVLAVLADQLIKIAVETYLPLQLRCMWCRFSRCIAPITWVLPSRCWIIWMAGSLSRCGWSLLPSYCGSGAAPRTSGSLPIQVLRMIISGAIGNIIDRFVYGHVIDYILFYTRAGRLPYSIWPIASLPWGPDV